jgi:hypothetical protein
MDHLTAEPVVRIWYGIKRITGVEALNRRLYARGFRDFSDTAYALIALWTVLVYTLVVWA